MTSLNNTAEHKTVLLAGLGNPGTRYANNRHNIGFLAINNISDAIEIAGTKIKGHAVVSTHKRENLRVLLIKPTVFMNRNGIAIKEVVDRYSIKVEDVLIIHDDLDLPLGKIRLRRCGSSGGHRGVQSVIDKLESDCFSRLKLGIGYPPGKLEPAEYVLQDFTPKEIEMVIDVLSLAKRISLDWVSLEDSRRDNKTWVINLN